MTFLISLSLLTLVVYFVSLQISHANRVTKDEYRFKFFELRDRVCLLVKDGKISENSWEYKHLVETFNWHIQAIDEISISRLVAALSAYHNSPEENRQLKIVEKQIESIEVKQIMVDYLKVSKALIRRNSRAQLWILKTIQSWQVPTPKDKVKLHVSKPKLAIEQIDQHLQGIEKSLGGKKFA